MQLKDSLKKALLSQDRQTEFFAGILYTDPDLPPFETQNIFRKTWLYIGNAKELEKSGTVLVTEIADCSLIIVRTNSGDLKAFYNVCPHRASLLCSQTGIQSLKQLVCPYHAWVYNLEGQLIGTPQKEGFPQDFCFEDFSLKSVRCESWQGFIFISFEPNVPPLEEFLGMAGKTLKSHYTEATKLLVQKQYQVHCNWKNYHDNTLCDYHVPVVHRTTLNELQGPVRFYEHSFDRYVNLLYTPTPQQWREENASLDHLSERDRFGFYTFGIFPNLHLLALPNGVIVWLRIDPLTVDTCQINLEIYGIPEFSPSATILQEEFETFMKEDIEITELVQKGYATGVYSSGIANQLEDRILHQQRLIREFLLKVYLSS
jgi:phenylpropionate dioxygenase-like ring-hydroxylating dioxygenase large terminal subunit